MVTVCARTVSTFVVAQAKAIVSVAEIIEGRIIYTSHSHDTETRMTTEPHQLSRIQLGELRATGDGAGIAALDGN